MATLSTLGQMMLSLPPQFEQYDPLRVAQQQNLVQGGRLQNQTSLLALEEAKRAQEEAAQVRQFMAANPGQMLGGAGPLLASPALTAGGGGPMMQQTVVPGQPPGAPQPVPGGQDLSRFAAGGGMPGGPPQSTLGGLQPQQEPFEARMQALMARSPGAALQVMQTRMKMQEQQLTWGLKSLEAVAQLTHGVKNQEDLDRVRAQMQPIAPQAAAQLPQFYSAEALEAFQEKALSVKERQMLKMQDLQAQAEAVKARLAERQAAAGVPKYTEDSTLNVAIDRRMQQAGIPRGTPPPGPILEQAQKDVEDAKVRVSASTGTGQIVPTQEGLKRINPRTGEVEGIKGPEGQPLYPPASGEAQKAQTFGDLAQKAHAEAVALEDKGLKPSLWEKGAQSLPLGLGNYLVSEDRRAYTNAINRFGEAWLRKTSGAVLTPTEFKIVDENYFPQPNDTKSMIESKRAAREAVIKGMQAEGQQTGRQPPPGAQGQPPPSGGQPRAEPTAQGPATFDRADFLRWRQGTGKTGNPTAADVEAYFAAKGLKRR